MPACCERSILFAAIVSAVAAHGLGATAPAALGQTKMTPPAPVCGRPLRPTPSETEGPYYKPNTPERASLVEATMAGTKLVVTGHVLSTDCKPIAGAWLDFWQANDRGEYDNAGYRLRGHQFTDKAGIYYLETILPGLYPGRTRHIHVKVRAPNRPILTTQLYFPGERQNQADGIFNSALVVAMRDTSSGKVATFDFVLNIGSL